MAVSVSAPAIGGAAPTLSTGAPAASDWAPAVSGPLPSVYHLLAGYNLLLALVWLLPLRAADYAFWICAAHAGASLLPYWLARVPERLPRLPRAILDFYPLLLLPVFWAELDLLIPLLHETANDGPIAALEQAIFGMQVSATWMPSMPQVWLSEVMHFSYFAYYAAIYLPPIAVAIAGRTAALRDMVLRLMVTYLACYLIYIAFPVYGPHFLGAHYEGALTEGFFYRLVAAMQAAGDSKGCAFPSSHVAGAVTIAFLGWRWLSRGVAILLTVEAVGVLVSTVYTQNHYAVDALSGLVWALALQLLFVPLLARRLARRHTRPGVPTLPRIPSPRRNVPAPSAPLTAGGVR